MSWSCEFCPCVFFTQSDFEKHMEAFGKIKDEHGRKFRNIHKTVEYGSDEAEAKKGWRKSRDGDGEWCFASDEPKLASLCRQNGKVVLGGYSVKLDNSGKYLSRRVCRY